MSITRHHSDARLSRAVVNNGIVYVAGTTADNRAVGSKGQTEVILAKIDAQPKRIYCPPDVYDFAMKRLDRLRDTLPLRFIAPNPVQQVKHGILAIRRHIRRRRVNVALHALAQ